LSEIRVTTVSDTAGTGAVTLTKQSPSKAWINFNGTGTIATRGSYNTSSITDGGTGIYDWAFTSNMSNGNYCVTASQGGDTNCDEIRVPTNAQTFAASGFEVTTLLVGSALLDAVYVCMSVNGDLA